MKIDGEESYLAAMNHFAIKMTKMKTYKNRLDEKIKKIAKIDNDSAKRFGIGLMQKKQLSEQFSSMVV